MPQDNRRAIIYINVTPLRDELGFDIKAKSVMENTKLSFDGRTYTLTEFLMASLLHLDEMQDTIDSMRADNLMNPSETKRWFIMNEDLNE